MLDFFFYDSDNSHVVPKAMGLFFQMGDMGHVVYLILLGFTRRFSDNFSMISQYIPVPRGPLDELAMSRDGSAAVGIATIVEGDFATSQVAWVGSDGVVRGQVQKFEVRAEHYGTTKGVTHLVMSPDGNLVLVGTNTLI